MYKNKWFMMKVVKGGVYMKLDTEQYSFQLILHSGNARSTAYEALQLEKNGEYESAQEKMKEAKTELIEAQKQHAQLLRIMASQEDIVEINLLLIHAEDHIASTAVAVELSEEIILLYERLEEKHG